MCGIAGFYGEGNFFLIEKMISCIKYRGPDKLNFVKFPEKKIFIGHARLSIIDIGDGGQPMSDSEGRFTITYNGEIYNHKKLRKILENKFNVKFITSHSDTEVILNGYKIWGKEVLNKLDGMFSFAIFDKKKNEFFLARDRVGQKPMYYYTNYKNFAFASELSSLLQYQNGPLSINNLNLQKYFAYGFFPGDKTLYDNIFKLEPGCYLKVKLSPNIILEKEKYWKFEINDSQIKITENEILEKLDDLLSKSVKLITESDVPIGAFVSGGVDSSILLTYLKKNNINDINTFTLGFKESSYDESLKAKIVCERLGFKNFNKKISIKNIFYLTNKIITKIDEPFCDPSLIPTFILSQYAKKKNKVILSGDGGDELFFGYDPFKAIKTGILINKIFSKNIIKFIEKLSQNIPVSHKNMSLDFKIKRFLNGIQYENKYWNPIWLSPLDYKDMNTFFPQHKKYTIEEIYSEALELWGKSKIKNIYEKTADFYSNFYLPGNVLTKVDRASMLNSIEVRPIFFTNKILEFCLKMPSKYKYNNGVSKYILKKLLLKNLPKKIVNSKKKGFGIPIANFFLNYNMKINEVNKLKLSETFIKNKIIEHKQKKRDNKLFLWALLIFFKSKILS